MKRTVSTAINVKMKKYSKKRSQDSDHHVYGRQLSNIENIEINSAEEFKKRKKQDLMNLYKIRKNHNVKAP